MDKTEEFDEKFQRMTTKMVEIAYEFVDRNEEDIDRIYVFGSIEARVYVYNVFFLINNQFVHLHEVNTVSTHHYNDSEGRILSLLRIGNQTLIAVESLFKAYHKDVPTVLKMIYNPKTKEFDFELLYELQYSNDEVKIAGDVFKDWFEEVKKPAQT